MKNINTEKLRSSAIKIALVYLIVGVVWILISDYIAGFFIVEPERLAQIQALKEWFYVLVTAGLLYALILRQLISVNQLKYNSQMLFEASTIGLVLCKMNGELVEINSAGANIVGHSVSDILKLNYSDISPDIYIESDKLQQKALETTGIYGPYEKKFIHKDGHFVSVVLSGCIVKKGREKFIWSNITDISIKKEMEFELHKKARQFKCWRESNFIGIVQYNKDGKILDANNSLLDMIGYSRQDLDDGLIDWKELTPNKYNSFDLKAIDEAAEKGFWTPFEKEYIHKDGHRFPILIGGSVFQDDASEYIAFVIDLSERKKADKKISETAMLLRNIIDSSPDLIFVKDKELKILIANQAYASAAGKLAQEMVGLTDIENGWELDFVKGNPEKGIPGFEVDDKKALKGNIVHNPYDRANFNLGVVIYDTLKMPLRDKNGDIYGVLGVSRDVSNRIKIEQQLRVKEHELQLILNSMVDAVITINELDLMQSFNQSATKLFGYTTDEIIGINICRIIPTHFDGQHDGFIKSYLQTGGGQLLGVEREFEGKHKDGRIFPMRVSIAELPKSDNGMRRFIGSFQDITTIKHQEEQLRISQKMDALGKLTGGIAHDFNNMLGVISGYACLLSNQLKGQSKLEKHALQIYKASERGAKLTRKLLSFSRQQPSQTKSVNINQLLENDIDMLGKTLTAKIDIKLNLSTALWQVKLDPDSFEDMLLNMSINAMHAMPSGGVLSFTTSNQKLSKTKASSLGLQSGNYVSLNIEDTGCGMSNEIRQRIFEPFFTTKDEFGTGLGLAQVFGLIQSAGGCIVVYSELNLGTRFDIYIPRDEDNDKKIVNTAELKNEELFGTETILVVDDEEALVELAQNILTSMGYSVLGATSGEQALNILAEQTVDVLLSDIVMPKMNGYQLAETVSKYYSSVIIIFSSGYRGEQSEELSKDHLAEMIIDKPYTNNTLLSAVRSSIDKHKLFGSSKQNLNSKKLTANQTAKYEQIEWDESMSIDAGGPIDMDHRSLLIMLNKARMLVVKENIHHPLQKVIKELGHYTKSHFKREEVLMKRCKYPFYNNHVAVHKLLLNKFESMFTKNDREMVNWLAGFLTDWLLEHIMIMDKALVPYIKDKES